MCEERDCNHTAICVWCGYCRHHARHEHPSGFQLPAIRIRWRQRNGNAPGFALAEMTASFEAPAFLPAIRSVFRDRATIPAAWQWTATATGFGRWPGEHSETFHTSSQSPKAAVRRLRELAEDDYYSATCGD